MHYHKRRLKWQLTTKVFNFVVVSEMDIAAFGAEMFGKKTEASYAAPVVSKNQKKYSKNS